MTAIPASEADAFATTDAFNVPVRGQMTATTESALVRSAEKAVWHLRLYVAGQSPKSLHAFANVKNLCDEHLAGQYEIEIIDLIEHPSLARGDEILAIPTLVRCTPSPLRKIIGDLSHTGKVLDALQIPAGPVAPNQLG